MRLNNCFNLSIDRSSNRQFTELRLGRCYNLCNDSLLLSNTCNRQFNEMLLNSGFLLLNNVCNRQFNEMLLERCRLFINNICNMQFNEMRLELPVYWVGARSAFPWFC